MRYAWRWYGPEDPVKISDVVQTGAQEIVSALHQVPVGEVREIEDIQQRQKEVRWDSTNNKPTGLKWTIVESLPVHEDIKRKTGNYKEYIEKYKLSIINLAKCGIRTIVYNFMPILDWTRTDLQYHLPTGVRALKYDEIAIAAFDNFILQREGAELSYDQNIIMRASEHFSAMTEEEKSKLTKTIIAGLPGAEEGFTLDEFREVLNGYSGIDHNTLRENHITFLKEVVPVAEANGAVLAIHPDDPPKPIFGLPRIMSSMEDIDYMLNSVKSRSNGLNLCAGSFGVNPNVDLVKVIKKYGDRIHFVHLRSVKRDGLNFFEDEHLGGSTSMFDIMKAIIEEEKRRKICDETEIEIPVRPDHGHQMLDDLNKHTNPGYSCIGRMKGLAEIRGMAVGIESMMK